MQMQSILYYKFFFDYAGVTCGFLQGWIKRAKEGAKKAKLLFYFPFVFFGKFVCWENFKRQIWPVVGQISLFQIFPTMQLKEV